MDEYSYNVNFRLYNGLPCNNYYTKVINNKIHYYDEFFDELDAEGIKELGIDTLTIVNGIPTNIADFIGKNDISNMNGNGRVIMKGGANKQIVGKDRENFVDEQKKLIDEFKIPTEADEYKKNILGSILNKSPKTLSSVVNVAVGIIMSDPDIVNAFSKYIIDGDKIRPTLAKYTDISDKKIVSMPLIDKKTKQIKIDKNTGNPIPRIDIEDFLLKIKKMLLKLILDKFNIDGQIFKEEIGSVIDVDTVDLSSVMDNFKDKSGKLLTRGYTIKVSNIQTFNYAVNLNDNSPIIDNNAIDKTNLLQLLLINIYPLLIQSNIPNKIKKANIDVNNILIIKYLINNQKVINNKYILDKSFLQEIAKNYTIIEDIMDGYVKPDATGFFQKYMFFFNKAVRCMNLYCYRPARSGAKATTTKQRQECKKCTNYRTLFYALGPDHQDTIKIRPMGINITESNIGINIALKCELKNVELIYEKFCYNNRNPNYWTSLKGIDYERGKNRGLKSTTYSDIKEDVSILYFDKKLKQDTELEIRAYNPKKKKEYKRYYVCELNHNWDAYPNDIIEIDHISGNHKDNRPENIQPLCKMCHAVKTYLAEDKAEAGTSISATDAYFEALSKDEDKKYDEICGFFYLKYVQFCKKYGYNDTLIGERTNFTTSMMEI